MVLDAPTHHLPLYCDPASIVSHWMVGGTVGGTVKSSPIEKEKNDDEPSCEKPSPRHSKRLVPSKGNLIMCFPNSIFLSLNKNQKGCYFRYVSPFSFQSSGRRRSKSEVAAWPWEQFCVYGYTGDKEDREWNTWSSVEPIQPMCGGFDKGECRLFGTATHSIEIYRW